jgi:hypothetical protein
MVLQNLAFLLPLKVILLAGSEGVPKYFRPLIAEPAHREYWIIGLAVATVTFYLLALVLDAVSSRLSSSGGIEILQCANEMTIMNDQENRIQGNYD